MNNSNTSSVVDSLSTVDNSTRLLCELVHYRRVTMEYSLKECLLLLRQLKTNICFLSQYDPDVRNTPYQKRYIKRLKSASDYVGELDSLFCTMLFDEEDMNRILRSQNEERDIILKMVQSGRPTMGRRRRKSCMS